MHALADCETRARAEPGSCTRALEASVDWTKRVISHLQRHPSSSSHWRSVHSRLSGLAN